MYIIKGEDLKGMQFTKDEEGRLVVYEPKGRYVPEIGETYWFISIFGEICYTKNHDTYGDKWCIKHNLVFRTKEECEDYKWFLEQLDKYSYEFSEEEWKNNNINKWSFHYDYKNRQIKNKYSCFTQHNNYYFTEWKVEKFRKTVGDERIKKYMFNIWE